MQSNKKFLVRHLGNMGDMVFFIPPVLETLKRRYPDCHITFVTAWGFKEKKPTVRPGGIKWSESWGKRNQSGFCLHLLMTNPHIDQLVHWHDTKTALDGSICREDGSSFPTWSRKYYEQQKSSGAYDEVYELDFGIGHDDNPVQRMYEALGLPDEDYANYKLYLSNSDRRIAREVISDFPTPRIVLLEGIEGTTTRGWDPAKVRALEAAIEKIYKVPPIWFGGRHTRYHEGRMLTMRENIATLTHCDAGIGVLSGPLHFSAAVGLPTITLYGDHVLQRTAPAYFLNAYIPERSKWHRTIMGPAGRKRHLLKGRTTFENLTPVEAKTQDFTDWEHPGRQSTKSCISIITVSEVMAVLHEMV